MQVHSVAKTMQTLHVYHNILIDMEAIEISIQLRISNHDSNMTSSYQ